MSEEEFENSLDRVYHDGKMKPHYRDYLVSKTERSRGQPEYLSDSGFGYLHIYRYGS